MMCKEDLLPSQPSPSSPSSNRMCSVGGTMTMQSDEGGHGGGGGGGGGGRRTGSGCSSSRVGFVDEVARSTCSSPDRVTGRRVRVLRRVRSDNGKGRSSFVSHAVVGPTEDTRASTGADSAFSVPSSSSVSPPPTTQSLSRDDSNGQLSLVSTSSAAAAAMEDHQEHLAQVMSVLRSKVQVRNRASGKRWYRKCFGGNEAVDMILILGYAARRDVAVELIRELCRNYVFMERVVGSGVSNGSGGGSEKNGTAGAFPALFEDRHDWYYRFVRNSSSSLGVGGDDNDRKSKEKKKSGGGKPKNDSVFLSKPSTESASAGAGKAKSKGNHHPDERPLLDVSPRSSFTRTAVATTSGYVENIMSDAKEEAEKDDDDEYDAELVKLFGEEQTATPVRFPPSSLRPSRITGRRASSPVPPECRTTSTRVRRASSPQLPSLQRKNNTSSLAVSVSNLLQNEVALQALLDTIRRYVPVKDRMKRLIRYKRCALGKDVVDFVLHIGYADTRQDAVRVARTIDRRLGGLLEPVGGCHEELKDGNVFYRFRRVSDVVHGQSHSRRGESRESGSGGGRVGVISGISATTSGGGDANVDAGNSANPEREDTASGAATASTTAPNRRSRRSLALGGSFSSLSAITENATLLAASSASFDDVVDNGDDGGNGGSDTRDVRGRRRRESSSSGNSSDAAAGEDGGSRGGGEESQSPSPTRRNGGTHQRKRTSVRASAIRRKTMNVAMHNLAEAFVSSLEVTDGTTDSTAPMRQQTFHGRDAVDVLLLLGSADTREDALHLARQLNRKYRLFEPAARKEGEGGDEEDRILDELEDDNVRYRLLRRPSIFLELGLTEDEWAELEVEEEDDNRPCRQSLPGSCGSAGPMSEEGSEGSHKVPSSSSSSAESGQSPRSSASPLGLEASAFGAGGENDNDGDEPTAPATMMTGGVDSMACRAPASLPFDTVDTDLMVDHPSEISEPFSQERAVMVDSSRDHTPPSSPGQVEESNLEAVRQQQEHQGESSRDLQYCQVSSAPTEATSATSSSSSIMATTPLAGSGEGGDGHEECPPILRRLNDEDALRAITEALRATVSVETRTKNYRRYKRCFVGSDGVDALIFLGYARTREGAVLLGRRLCDEHRVFVPLYQGRSFADDRRAVYRFKKADNSFADDNSSKSSSSALSGIVSRTRSTRMSWNFSQASGGASVTRSCSDSVSLDESVGASSSARESRNGGTDDEDVDDNVDDCSTSDGMSHQSIRTEALMNDRDAMIDLAESFRSIVRVSDRVWKLQTYRRCFVGSDAVDVLMLMGYAQSREAAVQLGQSLRQKFDLFERVIPEGNNNAQEDDTLEFEDAYIFYRFKTRMSSSSSVSSGINCSVVSDVSDSAPSPNARANRRNCFLGSNSSAGMTPLGDRIESKPEQRMSTRLSTTATVRCLRRVEVKDRRHKLKMYRKCFVGEEAVNLLISSGHAETREEAVLIGLIIQQRYDLFEGIFDGHQDFEDGTVFYRFKRSTSSFILANCEEDSRSSTLGLERRRMCQLWMKIFLKVKVKDYKWRLRIYRQCFVGSELVDLLVKKGLAKSRADASRIIKIVNAQLDLFEEVRGGGSGDFEDGYRLYRFKSLEMPAACGYPTRAA